MKHFFDIIEIINEHPLTKNNRTAAVVRFIKWEAFSRLTGYSVVYPFVGGSKLVVKKGMDGATGNIMVGLLDYEEMCFTLHLLKKDDLFVDIGANVGVYSVLASAVKKAKSIALEPVPSTFEFLNDNIRINAMEKTITALNIGAGSKEGVLSFVETMDCMNHVATEADSDKVKINVPVKRLDDILGHEIPLLMKIDVEGFECEVINGAEETLKDNKLKALIIEVNGSGARYGFDEKKLHEKLLSFGFKPYSYDPRQRRLIELATFREKNAFYLRDIPFIQKRLDTAEKVNVLGQSL